MNDNNKQSWVSKLSEAEGRLKDFHKDGESALKKYLGSDPVTTNIQDINLFAANVEILECALYQRIPTARATRRFKNYQDDVSRVASIIVENGLQAELELNNDFHTAIKQAVQDRLLPGLGQAWVRYESETADSEDQDPNEVQDPYEQVETGDTPIDYIHWRDFVWEPARTWDEVTWVAKKVYLDRDAIIARFGAEYDDKLLPYDTCIHSAKAAPSTDGERANRSCIYEIWDKSSKKVYWVSKSLSQNDGVIDQREDPLDLPDFFPCPKPLLGRSTTSDVTPVADFKIVAKQYAEANQINERMSVLTDALRSAGFYNSKMSEIGQLYSDEHGSASNVLIPVENWTTFTSEGGMQGAIQFIPLSDVVQAIGSLTARLETVKAQISEILGIPDIMRGVSKASESSGAQQLKGQYASQKLEARRQQIVEFVSTLLTIKAHLMCKFYSDAQLVMLAGGLNEADKPLVPQAIQLLRSEDLAQLRIIVEADDLTQRDETFDLQERAQMMQSFSNYLREAMAAGQQMPEALPFLFQMIQSFMAGFSRSREIEGLMDNGMKQILALSEQQRADKDKPTPQQQQQQAEMQLKQEEIRLKQQEIALKDKEISQAGAIAQMKIQLADAEHKRQVEKDRAQLALERANYELDVARRSKDAEIKQLKLELQAQQQQHKQEMDVADRVIALREGENNNASLHGNLPQM